MSRALSAAEDRLDRSTFDAACTPRRLHRWRLAIALLLPAALRARVDPDDVLQDVLQRAWEGVDGLADSTARGLERWIDRVLERRVLDLVRHHGRLRRDARRERTVDPDLAPGASPQDGPGPAAVRREQRARIVAVLDTLQESDRRVIVLRILQGYSTREVAEVLGRSPGAVAVTLHRALLRFRSALVRAGVESTMFRPLQ